jgi:hypothetical protein
MYQRSYSSRQACSLDYSHNFSEITKELKNLEYLEKVSVLFTLCLYDYSLETTFHLKPEFQSLNLAG